MSKKSASKELTSFLDRLASAIIAGTGHRFVNERLAVRAVLAGLFRVDSQESDYDTIVVVMGLLLIKHGGIRHTSSSWKKLAPEGVNSDYTIDFLLFAHFHGTAELPLNGLSGMEKLNIETKTFTAMHEGRVDWRKFQAVLNDFRSLVPILGERVRIPATFSAEFNEGNWLASLLPVIWDLDMIETGPFIAGEQCGRHRKISNALPINKFGEVAPASYFSNGHMPPGTIFIGGGSCVSVTLLAREPNDVDFRMVCESGVAHFQERFRAMGGAATPAMQKAVEPALPAAKLPVIPEVPALEGDLIGISQCQLAHSAALAAREKALKIAETIANAGSAQTALHQAESNFDAASAEVNKLEQLLSEARERQEAAKLALEAKRTEAERLGDVTTLRQQVAEHVATINTRLAGIEKVKAALAAAMA